MKNKDMKNIDIKKKLLAASFLSILLLTCELAQLDRSNDTVGCGTRSANEEIESQVSLNHSITNTDREKSWKDHTHHLGKVCQASSLQYLVKIWLSFLLR
ncbi:hypothetical protein [Dapis sp. BLCC M229]|uniref:hypothetical protein n=1 Tax=Dapis sp. BLCC M229 TaxID=3400188 RepID=UPI003CFAA8DA